RVSNDDFDQLVDDLRNGRLDDEIPPHGVLARVRQRIPAGRVAGPVSPEDGREPVWMAAHADDGQADGGTGSWPSPTPRRSSPAASATRTPTRSPATWRPVATPACAAR